MITFFSFLYYSDLHSHAPVVLRTREEFSCKSMEMGGWSSLQEYGDGRLD